MVGPDERLIGEQAATDEVCQASLEAAQQIAAPILAELADPESVLYAVASDRISGLPPEQRLGVAPLLLTDPSRSGVVVERWRLQGGELPADASDADDPEKMVALWSSKTTDIPPLRVPEGADEPVMDIADRLQMRGGGSIVFAREEIGEMEKQPRTLLQVVGAANRANIERTKSALAYAEAHGLEGPMLATVNPRRVLKDREREVVKEFAPEATNELELFVDSAIDQGFIAPEGNRYGVRYLPDGSTYMMMEHPSGLTMVVLAPASHVGEDGANKSGVYNAYRALSLHPEVVSDDFRLEDSNVIHVTSSHYGPMAVMNNLRAVDDLRTSVESFRVIGDNKPGRTSQAHLIEIGMTTNALDAAMSNPRIADGLREVMPSDEPAET